MRLLNEQKTYPNSTINSKYVTTNRPNSEFINKENSWY